MTVAAVLTLPLAARPAAAMNPAPAVTAVTPATSPVTVMPLGDSITRGLDPSVPWAAEGGYRTRLWQRTVVQDGDNLDFVGSLTSGPPGLGDTAHEGHTGWRIDQLRAGVDGWLAAVQPDIVLLLAGTNDILQNDDLAGAPARLADLTGRVCADDPGVRVLVARITPLAQFDPQVRAYDNALPGALATVAASCSYRLVDAYSALSVSAGDLQADGRHPSPQGYDKLADAWYPALTQVYDQLTGAPAPSAVPRQGLNAVFYPNTAFAGRSVVGRVDPQLRFGWGAAAPAPGVPAENFSADWSGWFVATTAGRYTFGLRSAGSARLAVAGATVLDEWSPHASRWDSATVTLPAGRSRIVLDYVDTARPGVLDLSASGPGMAWGPLSGAHLSAR